MNVVHSISMMLVLYLCRVLLPKRPHMDEDNIGVTAEFLHALNPSRDVMIRTG